MKKSIQEQITSDNGIANIIHALQTKWFGTQWLGNGITYEGITWLDSNDISKPTPLEYFNSFNIESSMQPDPVPISKKFIFLFLKKLTIS